MEPAVRQRRRSMEGANDAISLAEANARRTQLYGSKQQSLSSERTQDNNGDIILDFRLSHDAASRGFEDQLNEFLLRAAGRRRKATETTVSRTVADQRNRLLAALRSGRQVSGPRDVERFFPQQYVRNAFAVGADRIGWDGEPTADGDADWTSWHWSKRRVWTLRQVYLFHAPADHVSTTGTLLPAVYAKLEGEGCRTTTAWQRSTHNGGDNFQTTSDAEFPAWITNEGFLGAGRRPVRLRQFFHESCRPFELAQHLYTRNVVYYLVIRNHDYSAAKATEKPASVQIYVGKAGNGIVRRWLRDRWAHCPAVRDVLEAKDRCPDFETMAGLCRSSKLVDCYLAMSLLRRFDVALFVVRSCSNAVELGAVEAALIHHHDATSMRHGLNCRREKQAPPSVSARGGPALQTGPG